MLFNDGCLKEQNVGCTEENNVGRVCNGIVQTLIDRDARTFDLQKDLNDFNNK